MNNNVSCENIVNFIKGFIRLDKLLLYYMIIIYLILELAIENLTFVIF